MHSTKGSIHFASYVGVCLLVAIIGLGGPATALGNETLLESPEDLKKRRDRSDYTHTGCVSNQECHAPEQCRISGDRTHFTAGDCQVDVAPGVVATDCLANDPDKKCSVRLSGAITQDTAIALHTFLKQRPFFARAFLTVVLASHGGDADAAMALGRSLRSMRAQAYVPYGATCASACVLVLAGAVRRIVNGSIIVHRPFRAIAELHSYSDGQAEFNKLGDQTTAYLKEMNVPISLYETMLAVPPQSGRKLTDAELSHYGLNSTDPVYEMQSNAAHAMILGLPMSDYLKRKREVDECRQQVPRSDVDKMIGALKQCETLWKQ